MAAGQLSLTDSPACQNSSRPAVQSCSTGSVQKWVMTPMSPLVQGQPSSYLSLPVTWNTSYQTPGWPQTSAWAPTVLKLLLQNHYDDKATWGLD